MLQTDTNLEAAMGSPASIALVFLIILSVQSSSTVHSKDRQGPVLIGTFLNVFLYGIMVTQCLLYFSDYPKYVQTHLIQSYSAHILRVSSDKTWMKVLVRIAPPDYHPLLRYLLHG